MARLASGEHFVFTSATGKPLDRHNVRNQGVVPAARKAGLEESGKATVTTHDLRRTFISHLVIGLGLDPVRVQKIAGHSNVSVTLNTYAHLWPNANDRTRNAAGRLFQAALSSAADELRTDSR